ncbi:MAG: hypothetical protein WKF79_14155 [Nocardioides sp.]
MTFSLLPGDMAAASAAVTEAPSEPWTAHGADALATLAAALTGSSTAASIPELGDLREDGITGWCDGLGSQDLVGHGTLTLDSVHLASPGRRGEVTLRFVAADG